MLTDKEKLYKSYVTPIFSDLMIKKLAQHGKRGDSWKDEDPLWLLKRAREELEEVERALQSQDLLMSYSFSQCTIIANECADVANFMMMIADSIGGL